MPQINFVLIFVFVPALIAALNDDLMLKQDNKAKSA